MAMMLWLRGTSVRREGRQGRDYTVHDAAGGVLFSARTRRVPGPITVFAAGADGPEVVRGRPRRSFPITGRYDVLAPPAVRLGVATRSGRFYSPEGRRLGRFRDARSLTRGIGEGVAVAVLEGMLGDGGSSGEGLGASAYVVQLGSLPPGRLVSGRLPFFPPDDAVPPPPGRAGTLLRRVLPERASRKLLERRPPRGWLLDVPDTGDVSELLLLTAALLAIEIAIW